MHGTVPPYVPSTEDWSAYIERLSHYFIANGVEDATKKRSILLANCGAATYKLIRSLLTAEQVNSTSFEDIASLVQEHFQPKPSKIVQRFKFNTRIQQEGESIATYLAALRAIAEYCEYGETLKEMLRDRLVCGVLNEGIQKRLLSEKNLTYDRAVELAVSIESAERDTKQIKSSTNGTKPPAPKEVLHMKKPPQGSLSLPPGGTPTDPPKSDKHKVTCYRCGGNHLAPACKFKDTQCNYCKKKGHLARVCRAKARHAEQKSQPQNLHIAREEDIADPPDDQLNQPIPNLHDDTYATFTIRQDTKDPFIVRVWINNYPIDMEVDSGAASSLISYATYETIQKNATISPLTANQG